MIKNYYLVLEVDSNATPAEIRAAYRRLAKELHPDHYEAGSQPFLALQEAYAILSDPDRRRAYDRSLQEEKASTQRATQRSQAEPLRSPSFEPEPLIPEEQPPLDLGPLSVTRSFQSYSPSFDEIFGRLWRNFEPIRPKVEDIKSLNVEVAINPLQAFKGGRVRLLIPARQACPTCRGRGGVGFFECLYCNGVGTIEREYPVTVTFPPGTPNNYAVELSLDRLGIRNFYLTVIFKVSERL
jgi:DnaJ-class molecular chaperone